MPTPSVYKIGFSLSQEPGRPLRLPTGLQKPGDQHPKFLLILFSPRPVPSTHRPWGKSNTENSLPNAERFKGNTQARKFF